MTNTIDPADLVFHATVYLASGSVWEREYLTIDAMLNWADELSLGLCYGPMGPDAHWTRMDYMPEHIRHFHITDVQTGIITKL